GAVMYRRNILSTVSGFDVGVGPSTDMDLNLRLARTYPVWHNSRDVLEYRIHGGNASSDYAVLLQSTMRVLRRQRPWIRRDHRAHEALHAGNHFVENHLGHLAVTQLVADIRSRKKWRRTLTGFLALLRYAPRVLWSRAVNRALHSVMRPASATFTWLRARTHPQGGRPNARGRPGATVVGKAWRICTGLCAQLALAPSYGAYD